MDTPITLWIEELRADDSDAARLGRIEPAHSNVGQDTAGERQREVGDILDRRMHTGRPLCTHLHGRGAQ